MALRETIELDVAAARRQIQSLETALDSLATTIDIDVSGNAETEIRSIDDRLDEVVRSTERFATEMTAASLRAGTAEVNVRELAQALGISEDRARDLSSEILDAHVAANRMEDSARDIARQLGLADDEADKFVASLRRADAAAGKIDTTSRGLVGTFSTLKGSIAGIASVLATIGVGRGIAAAARGAQAAVTEFARLNESVNAVNVVFGRGADIILAFGETAARSVLLSQQAFQEAVVPLGALFTNFGLSGREAAEAAIEVTQRAADLASVLNGDVNEALLAINSALVGQVEPLRKYGAEISAARVEQFAFATGLAQTKDDLNQNVLIQARLGLILQDTAFAAGDVANTIDDYANAQRAAKAAGEEFSADIGEVLLPAFEGLLNLVPDVIEGLRFLIPAFEDAGTAAGEFFDSLDPGPNAAQGSPFTGFFAGLANAGAAFGVLTSGLDIVRIALVGVTGDVKGARTSLDSIKNTVNQVALALGRSAVAQVLTETGNKFVAFAEGIGLVARKSEDLNIFGEAVAEFGRSLGFNTADLLFILPQIIDQASQLGLSAAEVDFLTDAFSRLQSQVGAIGADRHLEDLVDRLDDAGGAMDRNAPRFTKFVESLGFVAEKIPGASAAIVTAMDSLADHLDPFSEASEAIEISAQEFFDNIVAQAEELAAFEVDLQILRALGLDKLADEFKAAGPGARKVVKEFLENLDFAKQAEAVLEGQGTAVINKLAEELRKSLVAMDLTPEAQAALIDNLVTGGIISPQVADAVRDAMHILSGDAETGFRDGMIAQESAIADDLQASLTAAFAEVNAELAAAGLISHLEEVFRNVQFQIGSGQLVIPTIIRPDVIDRPTTTTGGGGVSVTNNFFTEPQPTTDTQRITQTTSQIRSLIE